MEEKRDIKGEIIYCEWCGGNPYYISIHEEENSPKEVLVCKECYNKSLEE